jgi:two-component system KDP operon response regulator KdpE
MHSSQRVLTHAQIARLIWSSHEEVGPESLRPLVLQLRRKIEPDWRKPTHVLTQHKIGYRFNPWAEPQN